MDVTCASVIPKQPPRKHVALPFPAAVDVRRAPGSPWSISSPEGEQSDMAPAMAWPPQAALIEV